jgi:hypothetical protein
VLAVGREQVVGVLHRAGGADDRRLLADRQMQEAADLGLGVHLAGALLEAADQQHRPEPFAAGVRVRQIVLVFLLLPRWRLDRHWAGSYPIPPAALYLSVGAREA